MNDGRQGGGGQGGGGQGGGGQGGGGQPGGGGGSGNFRGGRHRRRYRGGGQKQGGQHQGGQHHGGQQGGGQNHGGGQHHGQHRQGGGTRPPRVEQRDPSEAEKIFLAKTPVDPHQWIQLEKGSTDPSCRAVDMLCPIGKGTRGLIVAPPKAMQDDVSKSISNAVTAADPAIKQYILLIDERPEEVTDFSAASAEVVASSSDQSYDRHVAVAEELIKRAVTEASAGADVFLLLDSLTRLARAHNQFATGSRTMSGGFDSRAMETPRRFFGCARKLEEGGSLTILATILVDTGSRMDEVIFQEFKGTGNMELVLSRQAAEMRMFPAMKVRDSGTRKEESFCRRRCWRASENCGVPWPIKEKLIRSRP